MTRRTLLGVSCLLPVAETASAWQEFLGGGASQTTVVDLPLTWGPEEGVAWRAPLPGYGQSSPVVWGGSVYLTSAEGDYKETSHLSAIDSGSGKRQWTSSLAASQRTAISGYVSRAAPTPAVDAERVYAFFESGDLAAVAHDGKEIWRRRLVRDYGPIAGRHGLGSSIRLTERAVITLVAHDGPSYLLAVDKKTGETLWRTERPGGSAWSSPTLVKREGREQIIVSASGTVEAYDAADGARLWGLGGLEGNLTPSPAVSGDTLVLGSNKRGYVVALRLSSGSDQPTELLWRAEQMSTSFASPVIHDGRVYLLNKAGVVYCLDVATGEELWHARLAGSCWASPVVAGDRIYFFGRDGVTEVYETASEPRKLAENVLDVDGRIYGAAPVDGAFFLRAGSTLLKTVAA